MQALARTNSSYEENLGKGRLLRNYPKIWHPVRKHDMRGGGIRGPSQNQGELAQYVLEQGNRKPSISPYVLLTKGAVI